MRDTGITRRIDQLGRISLPVGLRRALGISNGDLTEIFYEDSSIIVKKYINPDTCIFCGSSEEDDNMEVFHGKKICHTCLRDFRDKEFGGQEKVL